MYIAIAGNIGSGKTTLARYLEKHFSFHYIPQRRLEFDFIDDFFEDIEGNFFPAQVAFLVSKAIEIQDYHGLQENVVVDRSILEDIEVFARLWIENQKIDKKIVQLYHHTASFIKSSIPEPDLIIFCRCSAEVSAQRISHRPLRSFEKQYPKNYVNKLEDYYSKLHFKINTPYVEIDTEQYDLTNYATVQFICELIFSYFEKIRAFDQMSLFELPDKTVETVENVENRGIKFYNFYGRNNPIKPFSIVNKENYIYLAAPFSQYAREKTAKSSKNYQFESSQSLFSDLVEEQGYGELPLNYRRRLVRISKLIEKQCGMSVFLPHRDINNWGKTQFDSHYITPRLIESVEQASALVAIPGTSIGVHMEIGLAIAKRIPIVIFEIQDIISSFFLDGFDALPNIKTIKLKSTAEIEYFLKTETIADFLKMKGGKI